MKDLFQITNLTFWYPEQETPALQELSISLRPGEFTVVCGPSGCGKTTLLRQLKSVLAPHGRRTGTILFDGCPLEEIPQAEQARRIGFVLQSPEDQLVTDKVWHELAFGLESLGADTGTIRRRVAEMASFFGMEGWLQRDAAKLSGGQKQLLNLAAVMTMQPDVLILDEPTSQLDPIAASEFLSVIGRINRELGTTILMTEHRLEEVLPLADRVLVLEAGRLLCDGTPAQVGEQLRRSGNRMFAAMPVPMRVWAAVPNEEACPVTVRDGRRWLDAICEKTPLRPVPEQPAPTWGTPAAEVRELWFRYEPGAPDVVRGLTFRAHRGELFALLGGNGAGKTTALKLLAGQLRPHRGSAVLHGRVGLLPQEPQALFLKKTLGEDLREVLPPRQSSEEQAKAIAEMAALCGLSDKLERHPFDLSAGEQQRAALAKVLLTEPEILLLDEPTKGLDADFKTALAQVLERLLKRGICIIMVSHDVEFCAHYAHTCALLFDGEAVTQAPPRGFFSGNSFYTTAANRMARAHLPRAVTAEDIISACGGTPPQPPIRPEEPEQGEKELPQRDQIPESSAVSSTITASKPRKLSKRTAAACIVSLLLIPLTLWAGMACFGSRKYLLTSLLILLEGMLPFFLIFEGRKPQARELVLLAVLCALGVAGRAAFFMLPQFKPVTALTIVAGAAFGGETGFLVGAVTMLASNVLFSQGPWTPWQMFAMGLIGLLAGALFHRGLLPRRRWPLCLFGALASVVIYGGIMNPASALLWADTLSPGLLLTYYISGFPMDCIHGLATALFLLVGAEPMLEKLERVKRKYGLMD